MHDLTSSAISSLFLQFSKNRHPRSQTEILVPDVDTVYFGLKSVRYLGPTIWDLIPTAVGSAESFVKFKSFIKNLKLLNSPPRFCKDYIPHLGFVNVTQKTNAKS